MSLFPQKTKRAQGSIRLQFTLIFMAVMAGMVGLCLLSNVLFLGRYYMYRKTEAVRSAYRSINEAASSGEIQSSAFAVMLQQISARYDISVLVLDGESKTIMSSTEDTERMARLLWNNILGLQDAGSQISILEKTQNYTLQTQTYERTGVRYLVCWGYLDNGNMFLIESAVDSISESAAMGNRLLLIIGVFAVALGAVLIFLITKRLTQPITDLSSLSEEMKRLNFDAKYGGKAGNELDLLGKNMNELSEVLEDTISRLKTANNELLRDIEKKEAVDAERREFLSNVAHELKTPIALIQGYAEGLEEGVIEDEDSRKYYCDVIADEAGRMNRLVKALMTLSQLESGQSPVSFQRFDIVELIRNYLRSVQILTEKSEAVVRMEDHGPLFVWADEFLTEEVVQNYVTNAIQHLSGERLIEISFAKEAGRVRVSIFNTGEQIPEESAEHIWEKFYKVDKARTREYGGSGIGLSIVRAVMESMHQAYGMINYENGVAFWFELESIE